MRYEIFDRPDFGIARVEFEERGEQLLVESDAMVAKDSSLRMKTSMKGGLLSAAKRKLLGGESLFQNTFTAEEAGETLWVAPAPEGDLMAVELAGEDLYMNSGAFVASAPSVKLDTRWGGARGFFAGTGFFLLKASGQGPVFVASYGGIHPIEIGPEGYVCDTDHIVAFTEGLDYSVTRVGGLKSLFLSGEGLVCRFRGSGKLYVSTRSPGSLAHFVHPFRRTKSRS